MRRKKDDFLKKTADIFDLPGEVLYGEPRVTVTGTDKVHIENHRGLLEYGAGEIIVNASGVMIKITGDKLDVAAMSDLELVVKGSIKSVTFLE